MAKLLKPGDQAPDFTLMKQDGTPFTLSAMRGRRVLLWFYPEAETPGCTLEGCSLRDQSNYYEESDIAIVGISFDEVERNAAFAAKNNFNFPLLSDCDREAGIAYGACDDRKSRHANRISYLIDAAGMIDRVYGQVDPRDHAAQVLVDALGL
ncbi:MAG TPA: peroxiredoxin [Candidatus Binataceae bacterium]|jgi:peroxiredoxin Q/BCP|nr:peroxiredoxin [Candidatus Binataceae bacterium]